MSDDRFGISGRRFERFEVDRVVAQGGSAVVYAARYIADGRPLALKVLKVPEDLVRDSRDAFMAHFELEAREIAALRIPSVVNVFEYGIGDTPHAGRAPWMALEWLDGETLESVITKRGTAGAMSVPECFQLLRPLIAAVALAHESGVVHRDLKPGNIMVLDPIGSGGIRVLDFGIAKLMNPDGPVSTGSTLTRSHTGFSPRYAAPEQIEGTRTGPWTDVHALGLVLVEALTGLPPYGPGEFVVTVYARVASPKRPSPKAAGIDVGPWEEVLARALALKPNRRFANARELLGALERSLAGESWDRGPAEVPAEPSASRPTTVSLAPRSRPSAAANVHRVRDGFLWLLAVVCMSAAVYLISR